MNGFHLCIGRSHVGHGNGAPLWNANATENLWFSPSQHKSRLWGSYGSERETYEDRKRVRGWERMIILCPCCLVSVWGLYKVTNCWYFLPLLQTSCDPANEFMAIRVHYAIGVMSVTVSCNVLCVLMLLQHDRNDFSSQLGSSPDFVQWHDRASF